MTRPTRANIDLAALRHNCLLAQQLAPASQTVAVVKANAYGHGAVAVSQSLEPLVDVLAVACCEEALELRRAGISKPVLLLEGPFDNSEISLAGRENFWLMINHHEQVQQLLHSPATAPLSVWIKIDTGMHRLGFNPGEAADLYHTLNKLPQIQNLALATHFAAADQPENDFTSRQLQRFLAATEKLQTLQEKPVPLSSANSAAILDRPDTHLDFIRPGIMLYGSSPFTEPQAQAQQLQPVMSLVSEVIALHTVEAGETVGYGCRWQARRTSTIATIAAGYGDGYPRHAPNGTPVIVEGQTARLAGTVSMDMITVDVTDLDNVGIGSPAELWGKQLNVNEIASLAGTIGYELLTRMPLRVERVYINSKP